MGHSGSIPGVAMVGEMGKNVDLLLRPPRKMVWKVDCDLIQHGVVTTLLQTPA